MQTCIKYWLILITSGILAASLMGCSGESEEPVSTTSAEPSAVEAEAEEAVKPVFASIMPQEAYQLIEGEEDLMIIDVRTPAEREQVRISDSRAVSLTRIMQDTAGLPLESPLLLVCAVGGRSYAAALYLQKKGHTQLYNLRGGISAWERAGLPLEYGLK